MAHPPLEARRSGLAAKGGEARDHLDEATRAAFEPDAKIAVLATVGPQGLPHITLITTLMARDAHHLVWGQFCEGQSKAHVRTHPQVAFAVVNADKQLWWGRARWLEAARNDAWVQAYNQRPIYRYNAYMGVHTAHHMALVDVTGPQPLPLPAMLAGHAAAAVLQLAARPRGPHAVLKPWALRHLRHPATLKFLAWVGADGFPVLAPAVPAFPVGGGRLLIVPSVQRALLAGLKRGTPLAVFGLNEQTESVLVRGTFGGFSGLGPAAVGALDIDWVYNTMPPVHGQIYPPLPVGARA